MNLSVESINDLLDPLILVSNFENYSEKIYNSEIHSLFSLNISAISNNPLLKNLHFICNKCNEIPELVFYKINTIKLLCGCDESLKREVNIKEFYKYLSYLNEEKDITQKLKCKIHEEKYNYFCKKCKKNLCNKCCYDCIRQEHQNYIIIFYFDTKTIDKSKYIIKQIEEKSNFIDAINFEKTFQTKKINLADDDNDNKEEFLNNNIININNYIDDVYINENKDKNENSTNNIISLDLIENSKEIIEEENYLQLFSIILKDYNYYPNFYHIKNITKIKDYINYFYDKFNEMEIIYKFEKNMISYNKIQLFGEQFVNNNKKNCFLIINDKFIELKAIIDLEEIFGDNYFPMIYPISIKVKLIERSNQNITNLSYMFYGISSLDSSSSFSKFNTTNVTKMNNIFDNCKLLLQLPDISKWDTTNVIDMSYMFNNCKLLSTLSDISQWNTSNLIDASFMFNKCRNLGSLPEISNWKTDKVKNMSHLFYKCSSLNSLPDISKWKTNNINNISYMFSGCSSLLTVPDISKWNITKNVNIKHLFSNCKKLTNIPNISKWEKKDINEIDIFEGTNLLLFPQDSDKNKNFMNVIKKLFDYINTIIIYFCNCNYCLIKIIEKIFILIFIVCIPLFLLSIPVFLILCLLRLNQANSFIDNPLNYIDFNNFTNTTNHSNYINITNNTDIKNFIDFTEINKNITFQTDEYKIFSIDIILLILYISVFMLFIICSIKKIFSINKVYFIAILLNICIMIGDYFDFLIYLRLNKSFTKFFDKLESILEIKISQEERIKIINFDLEFVTEGYIFIFAVLFFLMSCYYLNDNIIKEKVSKTKNKLILKIYKFLK